MQNIEVSIRDHSLGVKNVYDCFTKLTSGDFISNFDYVKRKLFHRMEMIENKSAETNEFVKKYYKKMYIINDLYKLRECNEETVRKLAKIMNAMVDCDDN